MNLLFKLFETVASVTRILLMEALLDELIQDLKNDMGEKDDG